MIDAKEVQRKIIETIKKRGPSLPIQIAKDVGISSLFVSAFLSELAGDKQVKISSLKVGGSPLYFISGQEEQLEKFYNYLPSKEAEAFQLLKKEKILKDQDQDPAIRVALRAIKDFAEYFKKDNEAYWKYMMINNSEIEGMLDKTLETKKGDPGTKAQIIEEKPEIKAEIKIEVREEPKPERIIEKESDKIELKEIVEEKTEEKPKKEKIKTIIQKPMEDVNFNNPLIVKPVEKPKKIKPKSEYVLKVIEFLEKSGYKIIEEKDHKPKEYLALVEIDFELGPIVFFTLAKDKKNVSDSDLMKHLADSQAIPLPALFIYSNDLSKKSKEYLEKYSSILKVKKLNL